MDKKRKLKDYEVYVFKTSVLNATDIAIISPHLNNYLQNFKWSFDLEACDNILRVESKFDVTRTIIEILTEHNYHCEELK